MRRSVGLAAFAALALAASAQAGTLYQNDFSANAAGFTGAARWRIRSSGRNSTSAP
jgi:hypothetical protein